MRYGVTQSQEINELFIGYNLIIRRMGVPRLISMNKYGKEFINKLRRTSILIHTKSSSFACNLFTNMYIQWVHLAIHYKEIQSTPVITKPSGPRFHFVITEVVSINSATCGPETTLLSLTWL